MNELNAAVRIDGPDPVALELRPRGTASLHGRLLGNLVPADPCSVNLQWIGPPDSTQQAALPETGQRSDRGGFTADGAFDFEHLDAGRYFVSVSHWDMATRAYLAGTAEFTVEADGRAEVTVSIGPMK